MEHPVLQLFHPLICRWFSEKLGEPTDIQQKAWPQIARGEHVLITAPTGSGKTLTAFLWALQQLITGEWQGGETRVLYVSPLKALNNDVRRNLLGPLQELKQYFAANNEKFPAIRVLTRSGDTPQDERREMLRRPPEILITTPESLNLILTSKNNRRMLSGIRTVILDEIHAVLATKRGTHLITAVDRLVPLAGEFQRIALSATVNPVAAAADFVGGWTLQRRGDNYHYRKRKVAVCRGAAKKKYFLQVDTVTYGQAGEKDGLWRELAKTLCARVRQNRSTLVFCNNRRLVEKLTRFINDCACETLVYSHHGSLARELRLAVEEKLKLGELKGIVATNSLELGIDIGDLDEVLLVQSPPSLSSAVQRIGRAGHSVGQVSRGTLYPVSGIDFVEAAATSINLSSTEIEPLHPVEAPLDVLAQVIVSMTAVEKWNIDELYAFLKTSYPYRKLSRKSYELLLQMLAGHYAETRLRELNPWIIWDRLDNTVRAREGAERLIYLGGGTIPDRGYYNLRLADTKAKIGELDEEFVWERRLNDTFLLGTQLWQIVRITHSDVEVVPGDRAFNIIPFWRAEEQQRDFFYAEKIGLFLEEADECLNRSPGEFARRLSEEYNWSQEAAAQLAEYLLRQKSATGSPLPHRHHLLIEHIIDPENKTDGKQLVLHTFWGGRVNKPFAIALAAAWKEKFNCRVEIYSNNNSVMLQLPHDFPPPDLFALLDNANIEKLLRRSLESSSFFGARFRENAGRALLLPKASFKKRVPLWLNRLRAKKLLAAVSRFADFPIQIETWRSCLSDEFDLPALQLLLDEIRSGQIMVSETATHAPSPFCADLIWRQVNKYVYEDDAPFSEEPSRLSDELLWELLDMKQQPEIPQELVSELDEKLKRTALGYSPADEEEFLLWLKERLFIPFDEAEKLFQALERDHLVDIDDFLLKLGEKAAWIHLPRAERAGLCALEILPRICRALQVDLSAVNPAPLHEATAGKLAEGLKKLASMPEVLPDEERERYEAPFFVSQWLSYYGPVTAGFVQKILGLTAKAWTAIRDVLVAEESIVTYRQAQEGEETLCDRENMERLLRMVRLARRPRFQALPVDKLPLFLAVHQGVAEKGSTLADLQQKLEPLLGYVTHAGLWEEAILPARMEPYCCAWTDSLLQTSDLIWFGRRNRKIGFCFWDDLPLFPLAENNKQKEERGEAVSLFPDPEGRYDFLTLCRNSGLSSEELTHRLWEHVWRGYAANDSIAVLRMAILNNFKASPLDEGRRFSRRRGFNRWAATRPLQGNWYLLPQNDVEDAVEQEELVKERVRLLLLRYGVLFRELLQQELPGLRWRDIFRTLRLMEFSGELYAGYFFAGLSGLQFIGKEAYRLLQAGLNEDCIYWLNACDPASPCGLKLPGLDADLPARAPANFIVFHGSSLKVAARGNGKSLLIKTDPGDPLLPDYLAFFKILLTRDFNPLRSIKVETINGDPAPSSPYKKALQRIGFDSQYKFLELRRQYY